MKRETNKAAPLFRNRIRAFLDNGGAPAIGWLCLGLGVVVRLAFWLSRNFWLDTYSLKAGIITHTFRELLLGPVGFGQSSPIGFTIVSKVLGCATGYSDRALVFPMVVAGIATLFLLKRCLDVAGISRAKNLFLFVFALHPCLVLYSAEFKPYGLDVLVAAAFLLATAHGVEDGKSLKRYSALCALSPLFSFAAYFAIPASLAILFARRFSGGKGDVPPFARIRRACNGLLLPAALSCAVGGVAFLHVVLTMPGLMDGYWAEAFAPAPFSADGLVWHLERVVRFFRGPVYYSFVPYFLSPWQLAAFAVPVWVFLSGARSKSTFSRVALAFSAILYALVLLASHLRKWPLLCGTPGGCRLVLFFIPSVTMVLAAGTERVFKRTPFLRILLSGLVFASTLFSFSKLFRPRLAHSADTHIAIGNVISHWKEGDRVVVDKRHRAALLCEAWRWISAIAPSALLLDDIETPHLGTWTFSKEFDEPSMVSSNRTTWVLLDTGSSQCERRLEAFRFSAASAGLPLTECTNRPTVLLQIGPAQNTLDSR